MVGVIVLTFIDFVCARHKKVFSKSLTASHKMQVFLEMQFVSHCYTVVSFQPILKHSLFENSAVCLSGARVRYF